MDFEGYRRTENERGLRETILGVLELGLTSEASPLLQRRIRLWRKTDKYWLLATGFWLNKKNHHDLI